MNPFDEKAEHTAINCFVKRIEIKDGLADVRALVFDTDPVSFIGNGTVNLKTEALDIALKPHAKKGAGIGGVGKGAVSVGELLKPFKIGGTLARPTLAIDPAAAAAMAGKVAGGVATFGTAGIAAALLSRSAGDQNPCEAALETAAQGEQGATTSPPGSAGASATQGIPKGAEEAGKALKKLFKQ
jgi:hypothetical protein